MASETYGFVGVGHMGGPMATRLLNAGSKVIICDTDEQAMASLVALRAEKAVSAAEVANRVDCVFTLPTKAGNWARRETPEGREPPRGRTHCRETREETLSPANPVHETTMDAAALADCELAHAVARHKCHSACNIGSDSLLMQFEGCLAL
jgi:hypothetical protein